MKKIINIQHSILYIFTAFVFQHHTVAQTAVEDFSQKKMTPTEYFNAYKDIAIREMIKTGIPASITLAQGYHESGCGNSKLAYQGNNHFGIKCHKDWQGQSMAMWDDDPTESCFRVYENAEESYVDHSKFLTERKRYAFLFDYNRADYFQWAHGLKKAGYATDPTYPDKLINTIEKHNLHVYDLALEPIQPEHFQASNSTESSSFLNADNKNYMQRKQSSSTLFSSYKEGMIQVNSLPCVQAKKGATALQIASDYNIPYKSFLIYNDLADGDQLMENQYCFLQPKRARFKGEHQFHLVSEQVTMYEISQLYGISLAALLSKNMMKAGQEPLNGELISLNEQVTVCPKLRGDAEQISSADSKSGEDEIVTQIKKEMVETDPKINIDQPLYPDSYYESENKVQSVKKEEIIPTKIIEPNRMSSDQEYVLHHVKSGETLYSLGRKYDTPWHEIKSFNKIQSDALYEGQIVKIPTK